LRVMRYLRIIIGITFFVALSFSLTGAGDVYLWTDEEGVVHITDNPRSVPPGGDVERIRYRDREESGEQSLPDRRETAETLPEEIGGKKATSDRDEGLSEDPRRRDRERQLERAREEYDRAKGMVERRRRDYSRKSTRHNRDQYRHALDVLAQTRERLRELERQK